MALVTHIFPLTKKKNKKTNRLLTGPFVGVYVFILLQLQSAPLVLRSVGGGAAPAAFPCWRGSPADALPKPPRFLIVPRHLQLPLSPLRDHKTTLDTTKRFSAADTALGRTVECTIRLLRFPPCPKHIFH